MAITDSDKMFKQYQNEMESTIRQWSSTWEAEPGKMEEFLTFGSRFYRYPLRDNILIYHENPEARYCQSYAAWKQQGYPVRRGQKGIKVYVPVETTILNVNGTLVPLEHASKEERSMYLAGEIPSITQNRLGIRTVFDVAQTMFPAARYYTLFHIAYPETVFPDVAKGIKNYAESKGFEPEKISTVRNLTEHVSRNAIEQQMLPDYQKTFCLAAASIMTGAVIGLQTDPALRAQLEEGYNTWRHQTPDITAVGMLNEAYKNVRRFLPELTAAIEKTVPEEKMALKEPEPERRNIYERIKNEVSIIDYAREAGFTLKRVGSYYTTLEHDSIRLDPARNCYWQNSIPGKNGAAEGDSVIGFAAKFVHGGDMHSALKDLTARIGAAQPEHKTIARKAPAKEVKALELPERAGNMHRAYAYLTQTRYIDQDVVQDFVNRKMLYQDIRGNCVFVSYGEDGKPVFANFRGTLSERKFLGDVPGSDYKKGFYIDNHSDRVIVTESVIDAMSVMSVLHSQGVDYKSYDYLPLSGAAKHTALKERLQAQPKKEVLLALDHDLTGVKDMARIHDLLVNDLQMQEEQISYHVPKNKDWNADLAEKAGKFRPLTEIHFLENSELPPIHYCAVQSTVHQEERGFHKRNGKDQYRLVELTETGEIRSMDIKTNVIFWSPKEVRELIPNMYEELSYEELQRRQKEIQAGTAIQQAGEMEQTAGQQEEHSFKVNGFHVADGMVLADVINQGIETSEEIWQENGRLYTATGFEADHTYQEHDLTETERQDLQKFCEDNNVMLDEYSPLLVVSSQNIQQQQPGQKAASFLDALQRQEFSHDQTNQNIEMSIGIGG